MATGSYPFGGTAPTFTSQEILLYCLQVTVSTGACSYTSNSGSYTSYATISAFISDLQAGRLPPPDGPLPTFGPDDVPPDIIMTEPCYIVVELSSTDQPSLCFQSTGMTTETDCSNKYYALAETSSRSFGLSTVAYFAVPVVAPASKKVDDPYTLFLHYMSGGSMTPYNIDPCLRERGPG
jgi:hypothetical protein